MLPKQPLQFSSPVTLTSFPLPTAEVLNPSATPNLTVPSVNKTEPLESPLEISAHGQETVSQNKASVQDISDQPNGVATTQATSEQSEQTERISFVAAPVSKQGATVDQDVDSAELKVPEEYVPSVETPTASSEGPQADEDKAQIKVAKSHELAVATEVLSNQEIGQISEEMLCGKKPGALVEENLQNPKPCVPKDVSVNTEDGKATDSPETAIEDLKSLGPDPAKDELFPGDLNVNMDIQNEIPDKKESLLLLSNNIQSKGTSKCEAPPLSTHPLSGLFIL